MRKIDEEIKLGLRNKHGAWIEKKEEVKEEDLSKNKKWYKFW
jgi:hypothetical protein